MREAVSLRLELADGTASIAVSLGGTFTETNLEPTPGVASMEFWGQLPVTCATRSSIRSGRDGACRPAVRQSGQNRRVSRLKVSIDFATGLRQRLSVNRVFDAPL